MHYFILLILYLFQLCTGDQFPDNFQFGVATSSYQIEGAWNEAGKGENIWDRYTHARPEQIADHSTGDIACNSYYQYQDDIKLLKFLGVNFYRFSISWSRLIPSGFLNRVNAQGMTYYNNVINALVENNIHPMVTLYHWDLPQPLQDLGGWTNPLMIDYFTDYANLVFSHFGDRVKTWITFNEPKLICVNGYGDVKMAPGVNISGIGDYLCGHTLLKAHAKVYHLYDTTYRNSQKGQVGIAIHSEWSEPASLNISDIDAANKKLFFDFGWFGHPIFHIDGNYPAVMRDEIREQSRYQHFVHSRLPIFNETEIKTIQGTYDFLGLNMYTASMVKGGPFLISHSPSYQSDIGVHVWKDIHWESSTSKRLKVVPMGLRKLLKWIKDNFGDFPIIITENGYADHGQLNDIERLLYIKKHLNVISDSIYQDHVNVMGYTVWSLLDNFEWMDGYTQKYGLYHVDFTKPNRPRKAKRSAYYYRNVIKKRNTSIHETPWNIAVRVTLHVPLLLTIIIVIIVLG